MGELNLRRFFIKGNLTKLLGTLLGAADNNGIPLGTLIGTLDNE